MRKYLYTTLLLALLAQGGAMAQDNEGKKAQEQWEECLLLKLA